MKVRECFLQAVSIVAPEDDARAAWVAMNRKNAPWAAVCAGGGRLIGLLRGEEISERIRAPETFLTAGELVDVLAGKDRSSARAVRISPDADLGEAVLRMELAGGDAALVESGGRPPGVLELERARDAISPG
jgi:hypothetical protein